MVGRAVEIIVYTSQHVSRTVNRDVRICVSCHTISRAAKKTANYELILAFVSITKGRDIHREQT